MEWKCKCHYQQLRDEERIHQHTYHRQVNVNDDDNHLNNNELTVSKKTETSNEHNNMNAKTFDFYHDNEDKGNEQHNTCQHVRELKCDVIPETVGVRMTTQTDRTIQIISAFSETYSTFIQCKLGG